MAAIWQASEMPMEIFRASSFTISKPRGHADTDLDGFNRMKDILKR
jgi:hypothetical protein